MYFQIVLPKVEEFINSFFFALLLIVCLFSCSPLDRGVMHFFTGNFTVFDNLIIFNNLVNCHGQ